MKMGASKDVNAVGSRAKGFLKVIRMSPGESKGKSPVERKIFRVKWDQNKGDFGLGGIHEQGIQEPRP